MDRAVASTPVILRSLTSEEVFLLHGGARKVWDGAGTSTLWTKVHGKLAWIRCCEAIWSPLDLEVHDAAE
jgi:hypothetical protein